MSGTYSDPASMPDELLAALELQSGLPRDEAIRICRLYESLRMEHQAALDTRMRITSIDDASGELLRQQAERITEDAIDYIRAYSSVEVDTIEGYGKFEADLRTYLSAQIGARGLFALIRALDLNPVGQAFVDPKRLANVQLSFNPETGKYEIEADDMTPEQQRVLRALWIIDQVRGVNYRGLTANDRDVLEGTLQMDELDLTDQHLATLEGLLLKSTPNWELFQTPTGVVKAIHWGRDQVQRRIVELKRDGFAHVTDEERATLLEAEGKDDLAPMEVAVALHIAARATQRRLGLGTT